MPRKPRVDLPDTFHHVTARANNAELLFREPADRRRFLQQLHEAIDDFDWRCQAYCLMGTHLHLIVHTVRATLSIGTGRLLSEYARWFNWKYDRNGHVFGSRFRSRHIEHDPQLLENHRYIALNPVRAGHCDDPGDWRWGSYRAIAGLERAPEFLDVDAVHRLFDLRREPAQRAYRTFVCAAVDKQVPDPKGVRHQKFVRMFRDGQAGA